MAYHDDAEPLDQPAGGGAMSDDELAAHLAEHEMRAIGYYESEIASEQAEALDRYYRRPYGDERAGRSQVVDGTVAIVIDNATAAICKPFTSSEETVVFEPRGPEDEEQAQQATDYVNYVLHQDNPGFLILHDWVKDGLLQKVGVVKAYWEDKTRDRVERLDRLDPIQLQMIADQIVDGPFGPDEDGLYTADVLHRDEDGRICVENVPPEEYRISPYARPGRVPPYEAHITNKSRSELVKMGFDAEVIDSLPSSTPNLTDTRATSRYQDEQWAGLQPNPPGDKSGEMVRIADEYALIDYDGDGVAELRHIIRCDTVILFNEEVEEGPFASWCPVPMPHKVYGLSVADQAMPAQRIATVLLRQTLDNLYLANNPRPIVPKAAERQDGTTIDDLLSAVPGAPIRVGSDGIEPFSIPFVGDKSFPMLDYIAQQVEAATGISKHGQGMDPDALDTAGQVTATQAALMADGRNARAEMIARIFAETGVKKLFKLILRLLVQHQPRARMVRLRNKWVEMDPRTWNAEMDLTISVGLGVGNRAEQMATAQGVLQMMEQLGATPFGPMLIDAEKVHNGIKKFLNAAGIKNIDDYVNEPQRDEQGNVASPPPQPDPHQQKIEGELQLAQAKLQSDQQMSAAKLDMAQQEAALKAELAREEAAAKLQLEREKAQAEAAMNEQRLAMEMSLAERKMQMAERQSERDAARRDRDANLTSNRPGGQLDE